MKALFLILTLGSTLSAFASEGCKVSIDMKAKYLPEGFHEVIKSKGYEIVSRRDADIQIQVSPSYASREFGRILATHRESGFSKKYDFTRLDFGSPDPQREILKQKIADAKSVSEYKKAVKTYEETDFNDVAAGPVAIAIPSCNKFLGDLKK